MPNVIEVEALDSFAGIIAAFLGSVAPPGGLMCDGALISRHTYSVLFSQIGVRYGAGDGSTTFALPDLRGRFIKHTDVAADVGQLRADVLNPQDLVIPVASDASHQHNQVITLNTAGSHNHTISGEPSTVLTGTCLTNGWTGLGTIRSTDAGNHSHAPSMVAAPNHTHTASVVSGGDVEVRPRNVAINYIISTGI